MGYFVRSCLVLASLGWEYMTNNHELGVGKDILRVVDDYLGGVISPETLSIWIKRHPCIVKPYLCSVAELTLMSQFQQLANSPITTDQIQKFRTELISFLTNA